MKALLVVVMAYLIGNISTAYIMGKLIKKSDIRTMGSGNAGATNALRVYGKAFGVLTLLLDALKGVLAAYLGNKILGYDGALLASIGVVLGHDWPILLNFKGGKGIATSIGILFYLNWPTGLLSVVLGIIIVILTRYVSLASISVAALAPLMIAFFVRPFEKKIFFTILFLALVAIYKHKDNIKRLRNKEEARLGEKAE